MTEPLLAIRDLTIDYAGHIQAVRGASLEIRLGEAVGLVGESGSGKSTLASAITGLLPTSSRILAGDISFKGRIITGADRKAQAALRGDEIAMVFQDPMTSFNPVLTIGDQLVDFQSRLPGSPAEKFARAIAMLARVGIPDPVLRAHAYPHELSGGMRQRVAVARALATHPQVVLMDEPFAAVDALTRATLQEELLRLWQQLGLSIVFITHNVDEAVFLADDVVVMSAHPGTIQEIMTIDMPHPRDRGSAEFAKWYARINAALHRDSKQKQAA